MQEVKCVTRSETKCLYKSATNLENKEINTPFTIYFLKSTINVLV